MSITAIIPSRLSSSRIKRKPLVDIMGLPMIVHVYLRTKMSNRVNDVWVATDSQEIVDVVESYNGKAILTDESCENGTVRLAQASQALGVEDIVLVNGDEPLLNPEHIGASIDALEGSDAQASILVNKYTNTNFPSDFKAVLNFNNEVMYISRNDIPSDAKNGVDYRYKLYHIMTFQKGFLQTYASLEKSPLERIEDHEHLRILENGYKLIAGEVDSAAISVDTPDGLKYVRKQMAKDPLYKTYKDIQIK